VLEKHHFEESSMSALTMTALLTCTLGLDLQRPFDERLLCPAGAGKHSLMAAQEHMAAEAGSAQQSKTVFLTVGRTIPLQMSSKRPIARVEVDRDGLVTVRAAHNDQTTILVTGLAPGRVLITLWDIAGRKESRQMGR
jgi:hypothetical protein